MEVSMKIKLIVITILISLLAGACNLGATPAPTQDPGAIQTQAMETVGAQFAAQETQTALAIPPTPLPANTPLPTPTLASLPTFAPVGGAPTLPGINTPIPGVTPLASLTPGVYATITTKNGCNDGLYIGETPPYDGEVVKAGKEFSKGWQIQNTGECTWDEGYVFAFQPDLSNADIKGYDIVISKRKVEEHTEPKHSQTFIVKLTAPNKPGEYKGYWKLRDDAGNYFGPLVSVFIVVK